MVAMGICPASERKASRRREVAASAPIKDHVERIHAAPENARAAEKRAALDLWGAHVAGLPARPVALSKAA